MYNILVEEWLGKDNKLGIDIWKKKYSKDGTESFMHWLDRVSNKNEDVKELIIQKQFLFGGRILANRGLNDVKNTYSNCYVISPPEDNIESIFNTAKKLARTFSYGGGCGVDMSKVSFKGASIHNAAKSSSGAVSFMELYDKTTEIIGQNGRRGALMLSMSANHPDIFDFIEVKRNLNKINNANLSIRVDDEFMRQAGEYGSNYKLQYNRDIVDSNGNATKPSKTTISANELLLKLSEYNWENGEPGILFWDNITSGGLLSNQSNFTYAGVNPCAEEPLPAGGSCLLGAINLSEFVFLTSDYETEWPEFNYDGFAKAVRTAVIALNEVLDEGVERHPLQEQQESVKRWRQIGLGIMGFADALIKLKIEYGSNACMDFINDIGIVMISTALETSCEIAKNNPEKRVDLNYEKLVNTVYFKNIFDEWGDEYEYLVNDILKYGLANSQLLTVAPTGSISTMLGISGGIEPIFATHYRRVTKSLYGEDVSYTVFPKIIKESLCIPIDANLNALTDLQILDACPFYVKTAHEIKPTDRINVQSIWQKYIDAAISSTINLPNSASKYDIFNIYMYAWESGLKGVTVFRDGCLREGILKTDNSNTVSNDICDKTNIKRGDVLKIQDDYIGKKRTLTTGCGTLHLESFYDVDTNELRECFLSKGSTGGCNSFMIAVSRLISLAARAGVSEDKIIDQLKSCGTCPSYAVRNAVKHDTSIGSSCPVAVGYALESLCKVGDSNKLVDTNDILHEKCPKCGETGLMHQNGCITCNACGYTKCD